MWLFCLCSGVGRPYCRGGIYRKDTLRFLVAFSRLIREAFRQLALCAHEEAKAPSALRAQGVSPRCRLKAPDGNSAIVFAADPTPAVLPSHPTLKKSSATFLFSGTCGFFCCGNPLSVRNAAFFFASSD